MKKLHIARYESAGVEYFGLIDGNIVRRLPGSPYDDLSPGPVFDRLTDIRLQCPVSPSADRQASAKVGWHVPSATRPAVTIAPCSINAFPGCLPIWHSPAAMAAMPGYSEGLGSVQLLILDDWGLEPLDDAARHDLLEILEDRYGRRSTIVTSQLPISTWHEVIGNPTYADAILDRLVHNARRIDLAGDRLRRKQTRKA